MAKFYSSTFGAISGKHGTAVAVTRKDGVTYIRMHVKPSNPRTDKQQAHRAKFALTSKALVPFNPIFKETMGITNGISIARSYAFKNAIVGDYPNFSIDYEKLMFSFGSLEKLQKASTSYNDGVVSINWDFEEMYNCHGDDSVNLVVYNKDSNQAIHIKDIALRKDKLSRINIQDSWSDSELYFWAYVTSGDKISDSVFVEEACEDELLCTDNTQPADKNIGNASIDEGYDDVEDSSIDTTTHDNQPEIDNNSVADIKHTNDNEQLRTIRLEQKKMLLYLLDNEIINEIGVRKLLNLKQAKAYGILNDLLEVGGRGRIMC